MKWPSPCLQCKRTMSLLSKPSSSSSSGSCPAVRPPSAIDNSHLSTVFSIVRCFNIDKSDLRSGGHGANYTAARQY